VEIPKPAVRRSAESLPRHLLRVGDAEDALRGVVGGDERAEGGADHHQEQRHRDHDLEQREAAARALQPVHWATIPS
jgi:hypothetical protein